MSRTTTMTTTATRTTATPLPVIDVPDPCPADWAAMTGDARQRFCAHCQRHVHDLSAMRSDEVTDLICRSAGRLCVRFARTPDGQVRTLDYAPATPRWRSRTKWIAIALLAAFGIGGARAAWQRQQANNVIVGGIMAPPSWPTPPTPPALPTPPAAP